MTLSCYNQRVRVNLHFPRQPHTDCSLARSVERCNISTPLEHMKESEIGPCAMYFKYWIG